LIQSWLPLIDALLKIWPEWTEKITDLVYGKKNYIWHFKYAFGSGRYGFKF